MKVLLALCALLLCWTAHAVEPIQADLHTTLRYGDTEISVPYRAQFGLVDQRATLTLTAPLASVLPELERQLDQRRPRDNCASYKPDNWVVGPITTSLSAHESVLWIRLSADVEMWQCIENPLRKLDRSASDFKNKIDGNLRLQLRAHLYHDAQRAWVNIELDSVHVGGNLGALAKAYGEISGRTLAAEIQRILSQSTSPVLPLPATFLSLGGRLDQARWIQTDTGPALQAEISGVMTKDALATLIQLLRPGQP